MGMRCHLVAARRTTDHGPLAIEGLRRGKTVQSGPDFCTENCTVKTAQRYPYFHNLFIHKY